MMTEVTGRLLIGDSELNSAAAPAMAVNPDTGQNLEPPFAIATVADVERACELATLAFDDYRGRSLDQRAAFLEKIASNLSAVHDAILDRAIAETGLPVDRLEGEFTRAVNQLKLFARVVRDGEWLDLRVDPALPERLPFPRPDIRLRQIGLGPVAVFGSSNFPFAFSTAGGDTASALAAGCPVIVKGHLAHPGTGELAGHAIKNAVKECGLPEGVFSFLPGMNETGAALVRNPAIKAVGFTGSRMGGLALNAIAAARPEPIPVYAEMSSINPVFLFPGALGARTETIAREFVASLTVGYGQLCTNPGLIIAIDGAPLDRFIATVAALLTQQVPGPMLTAGIHAAFDRGVAALAGKDGVKAVAKGAPATGLNRSSAVFFETTVAEFLSEPSLADEVFGASGLLVKCKDIAEMHAVADKLEGQLTATLHVEEADFADARKLMPLLERKVGRILANGWPTGVEVCDAMVHGGPFPATSDNRATSVGTLAIRRFLRPISYQNLPDALLPPELAQGAVDALPHLVAGVRALPAR
jgi:NADP-dependent aldehyde dehydrogenase